MAKKINVKGTTIYDALETSGSYITHKGLYFDSELAVFKGRWEKPRGKKKFLAKFLSVCTLGLFGIVLGFRKKYLNAKNEKWSDSGWKKIKYENAKKAYGQYMALREKGIRSPKLDRTMKKFFKGVQFDPEENSGYTHFSQAAAIYSKQGIPTIFLGSKEDYDEKMEQEREKIKSREADVANFATGDVGRNCKNPLILINGQSDLASEKICDPVSRNPLYSYEHFNHYTQCVEINLQNPIVVSKGKFCATCVMVKVNDAGVIDLSLPDNKNLLREPQLVNEIIKNHPEAITTLPKEYFFKGKLGKKITEHYEIVDNQNGGKTIKVGSDLVKNLLEAFNEGLENVASKNTMVFIQGYGDFKDRDEFKKDLKKKAFETLKKANEEHTKQASGEFVF